MWNSLISIGSKLLDNILPNKAERNRQQTEINKAEIEKAPASILRLWRSFLGWVLALLFTWEVVGRLIILPIIAPKWLETLPPSSLEQVMTLLLGMLGLL